MQNLRGASSKPYSGPRTCHDTTVRNSEAEIAEPLRASANLASKGTPRPVTPENPPSADQSLGFGLSLQQNTARSPTAVTTVPIQQCISYCQAVL